MTVPLRGYVITMTVYASLVGALASIAKITGRDVPMVSRSATSRCARRRRTS